MYLTDTQRVALAQELAKPAYAGTTSLQAAELLNTPPVVAGTGYRKRVPVGTIQSKVFELGLWTAIVAASRNSDPTVSTIGLTVIDFFEGPHLEDVDMDRTKFREMLAAIKQLGITNDTTEAAILALADATHPSTFGPTPFQAIDGLGDASIAHPDGHKTAGTCYPEFVAEARSQ